MKIQDILTEQGVAEDGQRYKFQRIKFRGTDHDIGEERYGFAIGDNPIVFNFSSDEDNPDPDSPSFEEILAKVQRDGAVEHFRITPAEQRLIAKKIETERRKYLDQRRQGVAEGHADQQRKIFKRNGQPVGEVGIDRESSPGVGQWYVKHYASGKDLSGFDSFEEAAEELRHLAKQGVAEAVDPGRRKFLQRTAGAAAMAAAPKQTLGAIGKISQQAANVAKAASTNATLRALGAAAVQAVVAHHKEFGGEIGPRNYDGDDSGYWDGTDADWNPSVNPTESPFGPSRVKQTVSGRTFLKIQTGFSGDDIILTFLNDKGQPSWVRVDWVGSGQLSVKDVNVPGMKEVDPYDISDILEYGFDKGMTTDPDQPEEYSDKFRFPIYMRDGKEYEFLVDLLASGATSSNSGLKFAKKNPKWVEIASQYSSDDDYGDDNNTAKSAVADVAKSAATSGVRTQTIAGGLTAFKELVNRVLDKTKINRKKDEPAVKDMGRIQPAEPAAALPAPDRSAADIMAQLRDVVGRDLTDQEREVARQEVGRKS